MPTVKEGFVQAIIGRYEGDPGMLIPIMQDLQAEYGYLPPEELKRLSQDLGVPLTRVYGVAMFYASFRLVPKGRHEVTLCMGTVCYLKGAPRISEAICTEYGIQPGGTTADRLFTLQAVNCVGACALAPVMIVDGKYYDGVTPDSALDALREMDVAAQEPEAVEPPRPAPAATAPAVREQPEASPAALAAPSAIVASPAKPAARPAAPSAGPAAPERAAPETKAGPARPAPKARTAPKARPAAKAAAKPTAKTAVKPKAQTGSGAKTRPAPSAKPAGAKKTKPARPGAKGAKKGGRR
jgi:NADH-quinone oxidoreductase subunit E